MIKFTPKEIVLCKQMAGKYKKEIKYGDWYVNYDEEVRLKEFFGDGYREEDCIPLWTISDCLEFLQEKVDEIELWRHGRNLNKWLYRLNNHRWNDGKTPLEACLKAVLAVLEEGK